MSHERTVAVGSGRRDRVARDSPCGKAPSLRHGACDGRPGATARVLHRGRTGFYPDGMPHRTGDDDDDSHRPGGSGVHRIDRLPQCRCSTAFSRVILTAAMRAAGSLSRCVRWRRWIRSCSGWRGAVCRSLSRWRRRWGRRWMCWWCARSARPRIPSTASARSPRATSVCSTRTRCAGSSSAMRSSRPRSRVPARRSRSVSRATAARGRRSRSRGAARSSSTTGSRPAAPRARRCARSASATRAG